MMPGMSKPTGRLGPRAATVDPVHAQAERIREQRRIHQLELIKQQTQYGPLGVKLWFNGPEKDAPLEEPAPAPPSKPNRAPEEDYVTREDERLNRPKDPEEERMKEQFYVKEPIKKPETLEDFIVNMLMAETKRRRYKEFKAEKSEGAIDDMLASSKEAEPELVCKMCNLVFLERKHYEVHKVTSDHLHVVKGFFPGEGGYHCFLCWLSFKQAEGLLNHIERNNHLEKCERKGLVREGEVEVERGGGAEVGRRAEGEVRVGRAKDR